MNFVLPKVIVSFVSPKIVSIFISPTKIVCELSLTTIFRYITSKVINSAKIYQVHSDKLNAHVYLIYQKFRLARLFSGAYSAYSSADINTYRQLVDRLASRKEKRKTIWSATCIQISPFRDIILIWQFFMFAKLTSDGDIEINPGPVSSILKVTTGSLHQGDPRFGATADTRM